MTFLSACGSSSSPEKTTQTFFDAVKAGNIDKAIECCKPVVQEQYKAGLSIANGLFGTDSGALVNAIVGTADANAYKDYEFKVSRSDKTDKDHATVSVDVYIGGSRDRTTSIKCVRIDGEWYINQ